MKSLKGLTIVVGLYAFTTGYAAADWVELDTPDPFGQDFSFMIYATEINREASQSYAPESIIVTCDKSRLSVDLLVPGLDYPVVSVRYKFDDLPVVDEEWAAAPSGMVFPSYMQPDQEKAFLGYLFTRSDLTIEVSADYGGDGGYSIFSGLVQEDFRKRVESCEK